MAKKRMFNLDAVNTDRFLDMSIPARLLYFDLGMRADDEGFVASPNMIIRSTGNSKESLDELIRKGYVIPFKSGVIVITHWKMNNYLQKDRFTPTIYTEEKEPRVFSLQFIQYIDAMNWRFFHERIKTEFEYLFFFC